MIHFSLTSDIGRSVRESLHRRGRSRKQTHQSSHNHPRSRASSTTSATSTTSSTSTRSTTSTSSSNLLDSQSPRNSRDVGSRSSSTHSLQSTLQDHMHRLADPFVFGDTNEMVGGVLEPRPTGVYCVGLFETMGAEERH